jgi:multidrug transporter EmrE-like cation transporter
MGLELPETEPIETAASTRAASMISLAFLVVSVVFAIGGQLALKSAMNSIGRIGSAEVQAAGETIGRAIREPRLWLGLSLFGVSSLFWMVVLSRIPLSVAYPFVGVSYILIVLLSSIVLHEHVPGLRWVGVLVVAAGITIIGFSFGRLSGT